MCSVEKLAIKICKCNRNLMQYNVSWQNKPHWTVIMYGKGRHGRPRTPLDLVLKAIRSQMRIG